jgi:hypothetical protein
LLLAKRKRNVAAEDAHVGDDGTSVPDSKMNMGPAHKKAKHFGIAANHLLAATNNLPAGASAAASQDHAPGHD